MIFARALVCVGALLALAAPARGAITCTASVTSVSVNYDPTSPAQSVTTGAYAISCTRQMGDPSTFNWLLEVNDGLHAGGGGNNVQSAGGQQYTYETYRGAPYTGGNRWGNSNAAITGTLNFGGTTSANVSGPFDIVMDALQAVQPAGIYSDTLTATLREDVKGKPGPALSTPSFAVTVTTTGTCQLVTPPGNVNFTYTSFQGTAAAASTTYGVRCTTALPYTMTLDATSGTLLGLSYSLAIAPSTSSTGTGLTQNYTINGTMPAGQAGTCATGVCNGSEIRTLTVSW
jgi:spore coat protein U-like protein